MEQTMTALPADTQRQRPNERDFPKYRAAAHVADSKLYAHLADALMMAGHQTSAERAREASLRHERLAYNLLGLKGRER
jgi:hypothetical protein